MQQLQEILHSGECNCVVRKDSEIRTFNERGIAALHSLLKSEPTLLDGAEIADTIFGKGAAALMVKGGGMSLDEEVISKLGIKLFHHAYVFIVHSTVDIYVVSHNRASCCTVRTT